MKTTKVIKEKRGFLGTLDLIFNKIIPKKYTVMIGMFIITYLLEDKVPPGLYIAIGIYIGGSAAVTTVNTFKAYNDNTTENKGDKGGPE